METHISKKIFIFRVNLNKHTLDRTKIMMFKMVIPTESQKSQSTWRHPWKSHQKHVLHDDRAWMKNFLDLFSNILINVYVCVEPFKKGFFPIST